MSNQASDHDYEIELRLVISGFSSHPDRITEILRISPDSISVAGEESRPGRPILQSSWWLHSGVDSGLSTVDAQWAGLFPRFEKAIARFNVLPEDCCVRLLCIVMCYKYVPGLIVEPHILGQIEDMNAALEFDIFAELAE